MASQDGLRSAVSRPPQEWIGLVGLDGLAAIRHLPRAPALSATHSPTTSQVDDMRFGQLFGLVNHCEQERHDELNPMMC